MDTTIQGKIDSVLDRVKDPQSGMTVAQLGIVKKIRHVEKRRKLIIFFNRLGQSKACCALLNMAILSDLEKTIEQEFKMEFPRFSVKFANAQTD